MFIQTGRIGSSFLFSLEIYSILTNHMIALTLFLYIYINSFFDHKTRPCSLLRPQCQVLHGVSHRSTVFCKCHIGPLFNGVFRFTSPKISAIGEMCLLNLNHKCNTPWPQLFLLHFSVYHSFIPHSPHHPT